MSSLLTKYLLTSVVQATKVTHQHTPIRTLRTPFNALKQLHARKTEAQTPPFTYEKQHDFSYEPLANSFGNQTYVASQPDTTARYFEVPRGAYPTSSPYKVSLCLVVLLTGADGESSSDMMCNVLVAFQYILLCICKEIHWLFIGWSNYICIVSLVCLLRHLIREHCVVDDLVEKHTTITSLRLSALSLYNDSFYSSPQLFPLSTNTPLPHNRFKSTRSAPESHPVHP